MCHTELARVCNAKLVWRKAELISKIQSQSDLRANVGDAELASECGTEVVCL